MRKEIITYVLRKLGVWTAGSANVAIEVGLKAEIHINEKDFNDAIRGLQEKSKAMSRSDFMSCLEDYYPKHLSDKHYDEIEQFCFKLYDGLHLLSGNK